MRTQEEIQKRFEDIESNFGTQRQDLIEFMEFDNAKSYLKDSYIKDIESGKEKWVIPATVKEKILEYLPFAYQKAEDKKELSATRNLLHFKTWIWLDDEDFYREVIGLIEKYTDFGLPALDKIAEKYGYAKQDEEVIEEPKEEVIEDVIEVPKEDTEE